MQLTPEQLAKVESWAANGANLNEVQSRLKEEFGISLTYLDARLLMLDVGVRLKDKPRNPEPQAPSEAAPATVAADDTDGQEEASAPESAEPSGQGAVVSVEADQITMPGAVLSGKVTFSDGQQGNWYFDQTGRLGLANVPPGYRPPPLDIPEFQRQLDGIMQRAGF
jgi:hypothetical protein